MMKTLLLFTAVLLSLSPAAQQGQTRITFEGIDSFALGAPIDLFKSSLQPVQGGQYESKGKISVMYQYRLPKHGSYKIGDTPFGVIMLNFAGEAKLASVSFFNNYHVRDSLYSFGQGVVELQKLKRFLATKMGKEGKYVKYSRISSFTHYGYEWRRKGTILKLLVQHEAIAPKSYGIEVYLGTEKE